MPRRPLVFMGIDPSATAGGYCVDLGDGFVIGHCPIYELASLPWPAWDADRIVVAVECPSRMFRGSNHVVRSAANQWIEVVKGTFPRRVTLVPSYGQKFVDPEHWRGMVLRGMPGADWKDKALRYAKLTLPHLTDHNEAEAFCIKEYAKRQYRIIQATTPPRRRNRT